MLISRFPVLFFLVVFLGSAGYAELLYVSPSGSDAGPGTEARPWRTIQKAAEAARAGDTIYVRAGTYRERVVFRVSGAEGRPITLMARPGEEAIIEGRGIRLPADWGGLLDISGQSHIRIRGLKVQNAGPHANNPGILVDRSRQVIIENTHTYNTASSGIGVWNSEYVVIADNEVELACNDGQQECLTVAGTAHFEIRNNRVHHGGPGTRGGEGIDAKDGSRDGKIFGNHLYDLSRVGLYVDAWDKHTHDIEVFGNVVHDVRADGFALASESGGLLEGIRIYNNVAYRNKGSGLSISRNGESGRHPMNRILVVNNTMYGNGLGDWGGGIAVDNPNARNLVIRNNILSLNRTFQIEVEPDVAKRNVTIDCNLIHGFREYLDETRGTAFIEKDPLFVDAAGADFRLSGSSPAVDAGSALEAPSRDFAGNPRPQGSGYDLGAFELMTGERR
jgi:hypothetical protein